MIAQALAVLPALYFFRYSPAGGGLRVFGLAEFDMSEALEIGLIVVIGVLNKWLTREKAGM